MGLYPNITNTSLYNMTQPIQILQAANSATHNMFWVAMEVMIFAVVFLITVTYSGWEIALITASFLAIVIGMFLVYAGLMGWTYELGFLAIFVLVPLLLWWLTPRQDT